MKPCVLILTCENQKESDTIVQTLLKERLIVCAKSFPVSSSFYWKGGIDKSNEVLIIMDSSEELFENVEKEVKKLHSYDTLNLSMLPILKTSQGIEEWLKEGLLR